ncbi:MAG: hypothetical protein JWM17_628 [Actinobacteria bacterium]|nr:hypothetical protein [Actinomycetota bacterium]MCW3041981.1 hypothetical protein [Actinomycetota bacterium]
MAEGRGNPRIFELIEGAPKVNKDPTSPTIWAWPEVVDMLKIAGQPVPGPWPPHQVPRPDPAPEEIPIAVPEKRQPSSQRPRNLKADDTIEGIEYTDEPAGRRAAARPAAAAPAEDAPAADEEGGARRRRGGRYLS